MIGLVGAKVAGKKKKKTFLCMLLTLRVVTAGAIR